MAQADSFSGCLLCGKPLVYFEQAREMRCAICGRSFFSNACCEDGHFVCDSCHQAGARAFLLPLLLGSREKDPLLLLETVMRDGHVHLHGPEHHAIVPCVLLTAFSNCGGAIELESALLEALRRGGQIPGGVCGYWGVCGAAAGAGIYASILTGSGPLNREAWALPMQLVTRCLERIAALGGPRCCKRTSRLAVETAAAFTREFFGVEMPLSPVLCRTFRQNTECLGSDCPYFPRVRNVIPIPKAKEAEEP